MNVHMIVSIVVLAISFTSGALCAESAPKQKQKSSVPVATVPAKTGAVTAVDPATGIELVLVKGGCFQMGDTSGDGAPDERPVHEVCVADYYIGKFEVTQGQWQKIMGANPSSLKECGVDCPVENVSWNNIQEFILKLNSKSNLIYRLPTEAEWEYAARSGGKLEKWSGTGNEAALRDFAWMGANADYTMHKVGQKKPNGLGLYDMSGNAIEWCQDWYGEDYYSISPKDNPTGPATGQNRVLRGGDYGREPKELRNAQRKKDDADMLDGNYGFRLVRPAK